MTRSGVLRTSPLNIGNTADDHPTEKYLRCQKLVSGVTYNDVIEVKLSGILAASNTASFAPTCGTVRLKLLKIGALLRISVRRSKIAMAGLLPSLHGKKKKKKKKVSSRAGLTREAAMRPIGGITNRAEQETRTKSPAAPSAPRLLVAFARRRKQLAV